MKLSTPLLAAALALEALVSPATAGAATRHRSHSHHAGPSYPMKADEFRALMEKRIDAVRATIDRKLDRRGVSADRKKAIHKIFDDASKDLRAEIAHAAADGTVTQGEADKVKALTAGLRGKVRERLRAEKDPLARARLDKEEAAHKEKAAQKEKEKEKAPHKEKAAPDAESSSHGADAPVKAAKADVHKAAKPAGKAGGKKPGPTKHAKAAPGKKRKPAAEAEPGENL